MKAQAIDEFWEWFEKNSNQLGNSSQNQSIRDDLLKKLQSINGELYYELSINQTPFELVVTCEGRRRLFDLVKSIIAAAPVIDGWKFFALKQPKGFGFVTKYQDTELDPKEMWFLPLIHDKKPEWIGLRIGLPPFKEEEMNKYTNAVLVVLDTALGEQTAAEEIAHVELVSLPDDPEREGFIELPDLPRYLEWRRNERTEE